MTCSRFSCSLLERANDGRAFDAQLRGDGLAVMPVERVAVLIFLDGDQDSTLPDVRFEGLELLRSERLEELIHVRRRGLCGLRRLTPMRSGQGGPNLVPDLC